MREDRHRYAIAAAMAVAIVVLLVVADLVVRRGAVSVGEAFFVILAIIIIVGGVAIIRSDRKR